MRIDNVNSYLCNKLGNVIFFRIRHGMLCTEKNGFPTFCTHDKIWIINILLILSKLKSEIKIVLLSLPQRNNLLMKNCEGV
jgi:hypothetical protein